MWILVLNHTGNHAEVATMVARAETREELAAFVEREREPWVDEDDLNLSGMPIHKTFRRGSPIERFNPPEYPAIGHPPYQEVPSREEYMEAAAQAAGEGYDQDVMTLQDVSGG